MKSRNRASAPGAPDGAHPQDAVQPQFDQLARLPETEAEFFNSLAVTVRATVDQPTAKGSTRTQNYALPWAGFESWRDARRRLVHFERTLGGRIAWAPFNDSESNDGPMSLNAYPGRAFVERVTNEGDANLELAALTKNGANPDSPAEAAARWFGLDRDALVGGLTDSQVEDIAKSTVTVVAYVGDPKDPKDCILDARDFGVGLTGEEMPRTILSLNRGLKKSKKYLTGKHGQGASSTYQYSDLTLIASRKLGSAKVAFTLVEGFWSDENGATAKTPTYRYMTIDGRVPEIELPETEFGHGTLVRHIGYMAADLFNPFGETSLYGLLMRSLAEPLFPVWLEMYSLRPEIKAQKVTAFKGFRRYGRTIRGAVTSLERAWRNTQSSHPGDDEDKGTKILHRASESFQLPKWDFGGRTGEIELGKVQINYWVADPAGRSSQDVLRNWVDPDKTIIMTLDGQTHAEESRAIVTGQQGAQLWAVGRYMVVQVDCNTLDPRAKYEMFTSTREHAKETPIKKMILEEIVRRLKLDQRLKDLNVQLAAADIKQSEDSGEQISSLIKKYLRAAGVSFEQLTRKVEKWVTVDEEQNVPATKPELPPIAAVEPPTFVRWRFNGSEIKLHPGQRYSFLFETDAAPRYWDNRDQLNSNIKVTSYGVRYTGAGEMRGGRVRCHFECPADAVVGSKGFIQVQLDYALGQAITGRLPLEVVAKPEPRPKTAKKKDETEVDQDGKATKVINVKIRKKDFTEVDIPVIPPTPVTRTEPSSLWSNLGWPADPQRAGFSIRQMSGKIHLYYNAEFPPFLEMKRKMSKKSLEEEFVRRFQMKLVLHTIFTLNYDFVDEEDFPSEQKTRIRNLLCATAESLALATKAELEIEAKIKSEDNTPLESSVAAGISAATDQPAETSGASV